MLHINWLISWSNYLILLANPHRRQSFRCYQMYLWTGCRPRTGLSPIFCLLPPQTSPVTPIVDFSYRASRNIGRAIVFRTGTRLERFFYCSFLLGGNTQYGRMWPFRAQIRVGIYAKGKKGGNQKSSAISICIDRIWFGGMYMNNKTDIWNTYAFFPALWE